MTLPSLHTIRFREHYHHRQRRFRLFRNRNHGSREDEGTTSTNPLLHISNHELMSLRSTDRQEVRQSARRTLLPPPNARLRS